MGRRFSHVGIVVRDVERSLNTYRDLLGFAGATIGVATVPEMGIKSARIAVGETSIVLIEPTRSGSELHQWLEKRGEGLRHIAFEVDDIENEVRSLKERGVRVLEISAAPPMVPYRSFMILPSSSNGVLMEFVPQGAIRSSH